MDAQRAGISLGVVAGPMLALQVSSFHVAVISLTSLSVALVTITVFFHETLPAEATERARNKRSAESEERHGSAKLCWYLFRPIVELSILNRSYLLHLISALAFFVAIASSGEETLSLFYIEEKFGFTRRDIAFLISGSGALGLRTMQ
ncbi:hypothetical protein ACA910_020992 [Epithemia clementina (nom. ined.)]